MELSNKISNEIRRLFKDSEANIPLHAPVFSGNELKFVTQAIQSTFVSTIGDFIPFVENEICKIVGAKHCFMTVNGTSALHLALKVSGVKENELVIVQPATFVATANAISYCGADPLFIDVDRETLGLSVNALRSFLEEECKIVNEVCVHRNTQRKVAACVPMHTFGHPCEIDEIASLCNLYNIALIEDAAESFGSLRNAHHTGLFGLAGIYSFNGNKIVTAGAGGAIVTNSDDFAKKIRHMGTTAKLANTLQHVHDMVGYNYRMPNLNAALLTGQLENLDIFIERKRNLAYSYETFFSNFTEVQFVKEPANCSSNYWLNAILVEDQATRDKLLNDLNLLNISCRPMWQLLHRLPMFKNCIRGNLSVSEYLESCLINLPSSAILNV